MAEKKTEDKSPIVLQSLTPRATEKTYREQTKRTYAFFVNPSETKQEIAKRVENDFNVKVTDVRVLTRKGKKTKFSKGKHAYPGITFRRDHKLAYVTLAEGNSIRVFETQEQESDAVLSADETSEGNDKKTTKKSASAKESKAEESAKEDKKAGKENK